jgi:RND family efflux transporter MFP subunit
VLGGALLIVGVLFLSRPQPERVRPAATLPYVEVIEVAPQSFDLTVVAHGTVEPRTESDLVAEVRGRVLEVAPGLEAGGYFEAGEALLRLDDREYAIAVDRSRAAVKLAQSETRLANAEAGRRRELVARGVASDSDLEQFENRALVASATLDQARANLAQAELDLERTVVRAPFTGRVRKRAVDLGQFVSPGSLLAQVYAVDYAEVRLPIRTSELAYLEFPAEAADDSAGAPVVLQASLGGQDQRWPAHLVRTEGEIDLQTRMMHAVARIDDPLGRSDSRVPLPAGLFVRAEISGRKLENVFVLPTAALRDDGSMLLVADGRVHFRNVSVLRRTSDELVIDQGLAAGDVVIVSPMRAATDGMQVRTTLEAQGTEPTTGAPE